MPASRTGSTDLDELVREFKQGYALERTGGGHYRVLDRQGRYVEHNGKALTLSGTGHGGRTLNNQRAQLKNAGVLQGTPIRTVERTGTDEERRRRAELRSKEMADRQRQAQERVNELHAKLEEMLAPMGGLEGEGVQRDLAYVVSDVSRSDSFEAKTPDLVTATLHRVVRQQPISNENLDLFNTAVLELTRAEDFVDEWFGRVRKARGLREDVIKVGQPEKGEWPFTVIEVPIEGLVVDHSYQRPVVWTFVRKNAAIFDETLVGTIDVAERRKGAVFAIMDGQLRYEMCRLVGKKTLWCSVYSGLDRASEARFFLHKNRDKKAIHPFYTFKARIVAKDPDALAIEEILETYGYELSVGASREEKPHWIAAVAAVEEAYARQQESGADSLAPTLRVLKRGTWGMRQGQSSVLIRGLSIIFQQFGEEAIGIGRMQETLRAHEPELLLNRAREMARHSSGNAAWAMARVIASEYDRGLPRAEKLGQF